MLEGVIDSLGMTNLVLVIVGGSLLVVVLLVMSYFRVLISIANFTYPNAKYRAIGTPFITGKVLTPLLDSNNLNEVYQELEERGYELTKEATMDPSEFDRQLEGQTISFMKRAYSTCPQSVREFTSAWLLRFDAKMAKRALKSKLAGERREVMKSKLIPVRCIDEETIERLVNARDLPETMDILKEVGFQEPLQGKDPSEGMFPIEVAMDNYVYQRLKDSVKNVDPEERPAVKLFFGKYADMKNLKIVMRGLKQGVDKEVLSQALLPEGRELPKWKLESMIESGGVDEAMVELEGTSYSDLRRSASASSAFDIERYLDKKMLEVSSKVMSQNVLNVGPLLRFLIGKEVELRNLNVLTRGIREGISKDILTELMIMEDSI